MCPRWDIPIPVGPSHIGHAGAIIGEQLGRPHDGAGSQSRDGPRIAGPLLRPECPSAAFAGSPNIM